MLEQFRDIMIIISAFLFIGAVLAFIIVLALLFRKVSPIMNSARSIAGNIENVSSVVSGRMLGPVVRAVMVAAGLRRAASIFTKRSRGKEKKDGKGQ
ncbi:MAG: hypothetical protein IBX68_09100 [Dehalococcoidia bacterium]|nr:hypothetical protein [Dehalococcoidia bacterium]